MAIPAAADAPTIGMQIDSFVARLETLSSGGALVHAAVIAVSLAFSFYLLNTGGGSSTALEMMDNANLTASKEGGGDADSLRKPKKSRRKNNHREQEDGPEPRWHILKFINYVVVAGFLLSVLQFASNASTYLNDSTSLLQFLSVWSLFVVYFVGFFGISFVDVDDFVDPPPAQPQQQHQQVTQQPSISQVTPARRSSHKAEQRYVESFPYEMCHV